MEHFKHVLAQTPLNSQDIICMPFPFHGFWLLGKPLLMRCLDFRSKSSKVVPYYSAEAAAADCCDRCCSPDADAD